MRNDGSRVRSPRACERARALALGYLDKTMKTDKTSRRGEGCGGGGLLELFQHWPATQDCSRRVPVLRELPGTALRHGSSIRQ